MRFGSMTAALGHTESCYIKEKKRIFARNGNVQLRHKNIHHCYNINIKKPKKTPKFDWSQFVVDSSQNRHQKLYLLLLFPFERKIRKHMAAIREFYPPQDIMEND